MLCYGKNSHISIFIYTEYTTVTTNIVYVIRADFGFKKIIAFMYFF